MAYSEERVLTKAIREIANEENMNYVSFSYNWIHRLEKDNKVRFIFGYNFDINSSNVYLIAGDKSATYEVLNYSGVPAVPHIFFMRPGYLQFADDDSVIERILKLGESFDYKVVCKKNDGGFGGNDVYKSTTRAELEANVSKLFGTTYSISVSPLIEAAEEYRSIVVDNEIKLMYQKNRQNVVGDGESTLRELICNKYSSEDLKEILMSLDDEAAKLLNEIIEKDQAIILNWKHNLGRGALPNILTEGEKYNTIREIILKTIKALNIRFASIDVIESNNKYLVLEVNSGVAMQKFAETTEKGYEIAKEIYRAAILKMFE